MRCRPRRRMGDGLNGATHGKIVIRNRGLRRRAPGARARGVIVGQAQQDVVGHGVLALLLVGNPLLQVAKEHFDPNLVRHLEVEVGRLRGEVADKLRFGRGVGGNQRNRPWPFVDASAPFLGNGFAGSNLLAIRMPGLPSSALPAGWWACVL